MYQTPPNHYIFPNTLNAKIITTKTIFPRNKSNIFNNLGKNNFYKKFRNEK